MPRTPAEAAKRAHQLRKDPIGYAEAHSGSPIKEAWGRGARWITEVSGSVWTFLAAVVIILGWALVGPIFGFSDTWQLFINTGTTIVTFLMVFLIQQAQNRESKAVQLKLNEIIASIDGASNRMIDVEDLSEDELKAIAEEYQRIVADAPKGDRSQRSVADVNGMGDPEDRPRSHERKGSSRVAR